MDARWNLTACVVTLRRLAISSFVKPCDVISSTWLSLGETRNSGLPAAVSDLRGSVTPVPARYRLWLHATNRRVVAAAAHRPLGQRSLREHLADRLVGGMRAACHAGSDEWRCRASACTLGGGRAQAGARRTRCRPVQRRGCRRRPLRPIRGGAPARRRRAGRAHLRPHDVVLAAPDADGNAAALALGGLPPLGPRPRAHARRLPRSVREPVLQPGALVELRRVRTLVPADSRPQRRRANRAQGRAEPRRL